VGGVSGCLGGNGLRQKKEEDKRRGNETDLRIDYTAKTGNRVSKGRQWSLGREGKKRKKKRHHKNWNGVGEGKKPKRGTNNSPGTHSPPRKKTEEKPKKINSDRTGGGGRRGGEGGGKEDANVLLFADFREKGVSMREGRGTREKKTWKVCRKGPGEGSLK